MVEYTGKRVAFGVFFLRATKNVEATTAARRRDEAAKSLTNIDSTERGRRRFVGVLFLSAALLYAAFICGMNGYESIEYRARVIPLAAIGWGYYASYYCGL